MGGFKKSKHAYWVALNCSLSMKEFAVAHLGPRLCLESVYTTRPLSRRRL